MPRTQDDSNRLPTPARFSGPRLAGLALATILGISNSGARADERDPVDFFETLQDTIDTRGARWTPRMTPVAALSVEDRARLLGARLPERDPAHEGGMMGVDGFATLPPTLDWRDNGGDFTTEVKNLASCGSCWAFASLGAMEARYAIQTQDPGLKLDLSEQAMVSCSSGSCAGGYMDETLDFLVSTGTTTEGCMPYEADDGISCAEACTSYDAHPFRATGWEWAPDDREEIKLRLAEGPVMAGFEVFEDFMYYGSGVYEHTWGETVGYHAATLVGWDDVEGCWIAKNSWDTSWGEAGWFRMAYGQCSLEQYVFAIDGVDLPSCTCEDLDGDGFPSADCDDPNCGSANDRDDGDPETHPGAPTVCDGIADNDCDGEADPDEQDADADGFSACDGDCDDNSVTLNPDDLDGDGYSTCEGDEDDENSGIYPGADVDSGGDWEEEDPTKDPYCDETNGALSCEDEGGQRSGCSCDEASTSPGRSGPIVILLCLILLAGNRAAGNRARRESPAP